MKLTIEGTPEELREKRDLLLKALVSEFQAIDPDLADIIEKAIPKPGVALRYKALRQVAAHAKVGYKAALQKMLDDIEAVISTPQIEHSRKPRAAREVLEKVSKAQERAQQALDEVRARSIPELEERYAGIFNSANDLWDALGEKGAFQKGEFGEASEPGEKEEQDPGAEPPDPDYDEESGDPIIDEKTGMSPSETKQDKKDNPEQYEDEGDDEEATKAFVERFDTMLEQALYPDVPEPTHFSGLQKAGPFIGPRGGKWADAKHTIHWEEPTKGPKRTPVKAPKPKTVKMGDMVQSVIETEVLELAADPEGHGLDAEEARAYQLIAAATNLETGRFTLPDNRADAETMADLFIELSNTQDTIALDDSDPDTRKWARRSATVASTLSSKLAKYAASLTPKIPTNPDKVTVEQSNQRWPLQTQEVDWGPRARGQGKRRGGMIMGAMSDAPTGIKTYPDWQATYNLSDTHADEIGSMDNYGRLAYRRARTAGYDHDAAMLYVYKVEDRGYQIPESDPPEAADIETSTMAEHAAATSVPPARYQYGMPLRPPGPGAVPKGHIGVEQHEAFRHGVIEYDHPLTPEEIKNFDLDPLLSEAEIDTHVDQVVDHFLEYGDATRKLAAKDPDTFDRMIRDELKHQRPGHIEDTEALVARVRDRVLTPEATAPLAQKMTRVQQLLEREPEEFTPGTDLTTLARKLQDAQAGRPGSDIDGALAEAEAALLPEASTPNLATPEAPEQPMRGQLKLFKSSTAASADAGAQNQPEPARNGPSRFPVAAEALGDLGAPQSAERGAEEVAKSGPFVGPRGGLWADAKHTVHWEPAKTGHHLPVQLELQMEAREYGIDLPGYFASGSNHAGEIIGFSSMGVNVGVAAHELDAEGKAERALLSLAGKGTKVFVDSGAYAEILANFPRAGDAPEQRPYPELPMGLITHPKKGPITGDEWDRRLSLYERLADKLGRQLYAVAPDRVGDQPVTLERMRTYRDRMQALRAKGVNILAPIQKGDLSMAEFDAKVTEALGFADYVRSIPMSKDATTTEELRAFLESTQPKRIHLLGLGPKSPRYADLIAMVRKVSPHTAVTVDAVAISAATGRPLKGKPRKLTAAQDRVRQRFNTEVFQKEVGGLDYTDVIAQPSLWAQPALLKRGAKLLGLSGKAADAFQKDPDAYVRESLMDDPQIDQVLDRMWHWHAAGTLEQMANKPKGKMGMVGGELTVADRKRESIQEVLDPRGTIPTRSYVIATSEAREDLHQLQKDGAPADKIERARQYLFDVAFTHANHVHEALKTGEMNPKQYNALHADGELGPLDAFNPNSTKWWPNDPDLRPPAKTILITIHPAIAGEPNRTETFHVVSETDDTIKISRHEGSDWGPSMPKESLKHFINDLSGKVDLPLSGRADIDAVISGKAKFLGKGDDGLAFKAGAKVVKVSTTVPFQPENPGHRTPQQAADMLRGQVEVGNLLADKGVKGVQRSEFVQHGDKGFQIKEWVKIPEKLTRPQLDEVQEIVHAVHDAGYAIRDTVQAGINAKGDLVLFDVGKAAPQSDVSGMYSDAAGDIDNLSNLYREHGQKFVNSRHSAGQRLWEHAQDMRLREKRPPVAFVNHTIRNAVTKLKEEATATMSGVALTERLDDIDNDADLLWLDEPATKALSKGGGMVDSPSYTAVQRELIQRGAVKPGDFEQGGSLYGRNPYELEGWLISLKANNAGE